LESFSNLSDNEGYDSERSDQSYEAKLQYIESQIERTDLSKKDKRLLQNRKSALKCRIKKQSFVTTIKAQLNLSK